MISKGKIDRIKTRFYGYDVNTTTENLLNAPIRAKEFSDLIKKFDSLSENPQKNKKELRLILRTLQDHLHSTDPELIRISTIFEMLP